MAPSAAESSDNKAQPENGVLHACTAADEGQLRSDAAGVDVTHRYVALAGLKLFLDQLTPRI